MKRLFIVADVGTEADADIFFDRDLRRNGGEEVTETLHLQTRYLFGDGAGDLIQEHIELC